MSTIKKEHWTALYCRTSTLKQETGLEAQERSLRGYCESKAIRKYKVYKDSGVSGTKAKRPGLDQLMADVRAGNIDTVVVPAFSRFARSTKHLLSALEEFQKLGVGFVSLSEAIDLSSSIGRAVFVILAAVSVLERDLISERIKVGLKNALAKGKRPGKKKTVNRALILELRKKGLSQRRIARLASCSLASVNRELQSA